MIYIIGTIIYFLIGTLTAALWLCFDKNKDQYGEHMHGRDPVLEEIEISMVAIYWITFWPFAFMVCAINGMNNKFRRICMKLHKFSQKQ